MDLSSPLIWGQFITIWLMALALGLDALSLGLGIGMKGVRMFDILKISIVIAFFHMIMPLTGMMMGGYISVLLGHIATICGGILLLLLGGHMVINAVRTEGTRSADHQSFWGLILFSLSVSIDSFSVGVSLGMFAGDMILTVLMFGAMGGLMSVIGLVLGQRVGQWIGEYGEALGGVILLAFGVKFLF